MPKKAKRATSPRKKETAAMDTPNEFTLHIVSDATGTLANHLVSSVLTQFPDARITKVFHVFQDTPEKVARLLDRFHGVSPFVVHAVIDPESKRILRCGCVERRIRHLDLTRSLVEFIADHIGMMPADDLSRVHEVDEKYFQRVKALEFTTVHDDGAGLSTLGEADIVLVGPSRVSKSPTSMYLASLGYKTANVSITPETGFPRELTKVRKRVVAFTMQPRRLQQIRKECYPEEQLDGIAYHNLQDVIKELMEAEAEYRRRKYPVIDITNRTIEQVATMVLHQLGMMH